MMLRTFAWIIAIAVSLSLTPVATAAPAHKARHVARHQVTRHWHGYGFLPGYRPPEVVYHEREERDFRSGRFYAVPWPRFYRGRWNGGGFGPCFTYTPIGPMWNCGR